MKNRLQLMKDLARKAGRIQLDRVGDSHDIQYKGAINLVTEVDKKCEEMIVGEVQKHFPGDDILAEEGGGDRTSSKVRWHIDPLDGTVNYAHGFPFFCVSLAIEVEGNLHAGVIYDPNRDELFEAIIGQGAMMNGRPIRVSKNNPLEKSMVATGFAYSVREDEKLDNLGNFAKFVKRARAVRRPGSAAIDLAWVACGRLDGFWEIFLKPWDMAAGVVIIRESGGNVSSFDGSPYDLYGTEILASNGVIHAEMSGLLIADR